MPRKPFIYSENAEYQKEYQRSLKRIFISFNPRSEEDSALLNHIQSQGSVTQYIKRLVQEDIERRKNR